MNRRTWTTLLSIVMAGLLSSQVQAQSYDPGPLPTIGDIQTMCVEQYPAPQDRTDVGIGEDITCSIDTSTWQDTDIYTDPYGNQWNVSDTLGEITWDVSGPGTIYPTVGDSTTLTIDLMDADAPVTVIAMAYDSGTLGADPPVQKQKVLNAKVPTGVDPVGFTDLPPFQAGTDLIGCRTNFILQVTPKNVNFNNTFVRENFPDYTWTWPNGQDDKIPGAKTPGVKPKTGQAGPVTLPNIIPDIVGTYGADYTVDYLKDKNTGQYVDFDKPIPKIPLEYQDKDGKWQNFDNTGTRPRHWTGATKAGRCGVVAITELWGKDQGPFKKPN